MNNIEKIQGFLSAHGIEKPCTGGIGGIIHTYSLFMEYLKWVKVNKFRVCSHTLFLQVLVESGFKLTDGSETCFIVNATTLHDTMKKIPYKSRYGFEKGVKYGYLEIS
jgi:hypothetical protein